MKLIKHLVAISLGVSLIGCSTSQQTTTYNALVSVELTADVSYSNYVAKVISGQISTNSLPKISSAYNELHQAIGLANTLNTAGTNALVPANLTLELTDFVNLVVSALTNK